MSRESHPKHQNLSASSSPSLESLTEARFSRRTTLKGGLGLALSTLFAGSGVAALSGCSRSVPGNSPESALSLGFTSIPGSSADELIVPEGYVAEVLTPWGTPIHLNARDFATDGVGSINTAEEQALQMGENHDGMHYFPLSDTDPSASGLLVVNHEYTNPTLYPGAQRAEDESGLPRNADQVRKAIYAHGVSIIEIRRTASGSYEMVPDSPYNRRIHAATPVRISGPAAGADLFRTAYDPTGFTGRGTLNNCANGYTPWGTYLTCEENIQDYFTTSEDAPPREKARMGIGRDTFNYGWYGVAADPTERDGEFGRFDTTPKSDGPATDFRNEANTFGWVVEIDPKDPQSTPVKRTALGRFRHEACQPGRISPGKQLAFYMGDDARFEYFYKFVTADSYQPGQTDRDMLDRGTLYVARFHADGSGEWLPLEFGLGPLVEPLFSSQADVLINTRSAADALGATPMDRPEWSTTDPITGEIYLTLTNNSRRAAGQENAPNPRGPNHHGHIVRLAEAGGEPNATGFHWDIFVFGANADAPPAYNRSGLSLDNEFGSPDGLWFDPRGILWIQTDHDTGYLDSHSNDQMLAVIPASLPGDRTINPSTQASLKRFLVGPVGCEVTGIAMTPDYRTLFINIQHPTGHWPDGGDSVPRSSTVVIRREDGGEIAL